MGARHLIQRPAAIVVGASDVALLQRTQEALEAEGHTVTLFDCPGKMLEALPSLRTELAILAFDAMHEDGFQLCNLLHSKRETLPILVECNAEDERVLSAAFEAGATDILIQPVNWSLFGRRLRALLKASRLISALRSSHFSFENVQRIAGIGSWQLNAENGSMIWSAQTFRILGLKPGEVKANQEHYSMCIHPEDRDSVVQQMQDAVTGMNSFEFGHRIVHGSGAVRHVHLRGEPLSEVARRFQGTIQDVTEQRRTQEKIRYLAHYDSLTGLSNRRRFKDQLERAIERARARGNYMALLYMDLDQFKRINDTLGHSAGDRLLQHVAEVLYDKVRTTDIIGRNVDQGDGPGQPPEAEVEISRLGGDEFAVVLSEISSPEDAGQVAERILGSVTTPITFEDHQIATTASIGIAIYPEDGQDSETLIKHADTAMYAAKERGRNTSQFYSQTMNAGTLRKLTLETHLREALEKNQLRVLYQPRMDIQNRRIRGVEALLRWDHPSLGPVLPKEFIPVAEETGLIVPIGEWVLETACAQTKAWRISGCGQIGISVNVSSRQFIHHNIHETVTEVLRKTGLDPKQLELEITESVVLEDDKGTGEMLRQMKDMGVRIALDDFGTGYSSLSYLTKFPLDTLKLDRSLVRDLGHDPTARGVANAVIGMAHAVNLSVTAEGVDEVEQARFLSEQGCDELQGFLVAGPLSPEECMQFFTPGGTVTAAELDAIFGGEEDEKTAETPS